MVRRTFGQVKSELSQTAGQTGLPVTDALMLQYVNNAVQELANEGEWPGVVDRWYFAFDQTTALVTLPSHLQRLISVTVDDCPKEIRSPWYEFVQYGPGIQREADQYRTNRRGWVDVVMDRGDVATQFPFPPPETGPYSLCIESQVDEDADARVLLQGLDSDGNIIRSLSDGTSGDWQTGVSLTIGTSSQCTDPILFQSLSAATKPVTNGPVTLTADNGTTVFPLATWQYDETNPSYRSYFIPALYRSTLDPTRPRVILARCRRRFVPVLSDSDELMVSNILALQEMMIAQWYRTVPDIAQYGAHKSAAVDIMRKEALAYVGKSRTPSLTFSRGFPVGAVQYLR